MKLMKCISAALVATVLGANAALLTGVSVETFSSEISFVDRLAENTVDGGGLSGAGLVTDTHDGNADNMWLTEGEAIGTDTDPSITFNLGALYNVDTLRIWNFNEATFTHHGADEILVSAGASLGSLTQTQTISVVEGGGTATEPAQDFAASFTGVQYIRFTINSNHDGDDFVNNDFSSGSTAEQFAGLSEVRFEGTPAGPLTGVVTNPIPAHTATEIEPDITLYWDANDPGMEVTHFNVVLGVGGQVYNYVVDSSTVARTASETHTYTPPANMIQTGGPYWWRVDKVTAAETITGQVWTFTTRDETTQERDARMAWFREGKMFTAWYYGLYCGAEGVWPPQTGTHDPSWTYAEWMQFWAGEATLPYRDALEPFLTGANFNATEQAQLCKAAGMECVYVVARHHDGYALWDTATSTLLAPTGFKVGNSPYNPTNRDYLKEITDALRAEGLKVGLYFSLGDWHHPDFPKDGSWAHPTNVQDPPGHVGDFSNFVDYLYEQCTEIVDPTAGTDYGTFDVIYFDYSSNGINGEDWGASKLVHLVRKHNPNVIINNRLWNGLDNPNGDFATPEADISHVDYGEYGDRDWEAIMSVSEPPSWGYGGTTHYPFKSVQDLLRDVVEAAAKGGTIEVSFSPKADGTIHPELVAQYTGLGGWMSTNSTSIKGTTANPIGVKPVWGDYTSKKAQSKLYMHVFDPPVDGNIVAEGMVGTVSGASLLSDGTPLTVTPLIDGFQVHLPAELQDPINTVIVVDYEFPELPINTTTVADFSSENVIGLDRAAVHTVDSSGLTGGAAIQYHAGGEDGIVWTTVGSLGPGTDYDPYITFDLGGVYDVTSIQEWGYNGMWVSEGVTNVFTAVGPDAVDIYTSTNGVDFTFAETVNFSQAPGADGYSGNNVPVDLPNTRYIKLDIMTNHDGAIFDGTGNLGGADGRSLTGLSEIRFNTRADAVDDLTISGPVAGGEGMELSWTAEPGKAYTVETNSNLIMSGGWGPYMTGLLGHGGTISIVVTNDLVPDQTFYRVISE